MKSQVNVPVKPQNNNAGNNAERLKHQTMGSKNKHRVYSRVIFQKSAQEAVRSAAKNVKLLEENQETEGLLSGLPNNSGPKFQV